VPYFFTEGHWSACYYKSSYYWIQMLHMYLGSISYTLSKFNITDFHKKKLTLFPMLHMGYLSPSVIALVYNFTSLYKNIWFHPGGDMIAFVFKSTRLVVIVFLQETWMRPLNCSQKPLQWILCLPYSMQKEQGEFCNFNCFLSYIVRPSVRLCVRQQFL